MSVKDAILAARPTSYWPLDDLGGSSSCRDEMGLHDALLPSAGVMLSVLPFGTSQAPFFDGALKSVLTIPDDPQCSQVRPLRGKGGYGVGRRRMGAQILQSAK
jgi:hypothetical protein